MIYIVSGLHRSGTSMMMTALRAGGIELFFSEAREKKMTRRNRAGGYIANDTFFEVGQRDFMKIGFSATIPSGSAVKIQAKGLPLLGVREEYKIIYMRRDPEAIKSSFVTAFSVREFNRMHKNWPEDYWKLLDGVKGIMEKRSDVELLELWYDDVVSDPIGAMTKIKELGVPIDIDAAASIVDVDKRRFSA